MKDVLHLLAFEFRRMRVWLFLWSCLHVFLLVQAFRILDAETGRTWMSMGKMIYVPWLAGLGLMLTSGLGPANPNSPLRLLPVPPSLCTRARITLLLLGIFLPALLCALLFSARVSHEFSSFLAAGHFIFIRLLPFSLFAAAVGNRRKNLLDAVGTFLFLGIAGLLTVGLAHLLRFTLNVQDTAWTSFWWTGGIATVICGILTVDWFRVDLGKSTPSETKKGFSALLPLLFLFFVLEFRADPLEYGHPPVALGLETGDLEVGVTPNQKSYGGVLRHDSGTSGFTSRVPDPDMQSGATWFFNGEIQVRGLPPGISFVARVEESEWTPPGGEPVPASFRDRNMKSRSFSHRPPPPHLDQYPFRAVESGERTHEHFSAPLFAADVETYERYGTQSGRLRAVIRLDLYRFERIERFPFEDGPASRRLPGRRRINSYTTTVPGKEGVQFELAILRQNPALRQPIGMEWSNALQFGAVDTRTESGLSRRGAGSGGGESVPGFQLRTYSATYVADHEMSGKDTPPPDPAHTDIVILSPVYQGSLHVEVTLEDVSLLPEDQTGDRP